MALLRTTLPDCDDGPFRLAFKALFPGDNEEKKLVLFTLLICGYLQFRHSNFQLSNLSD